jgi:hypothetical protein
LRADDVLARVHRTALIVCGAWAGVGFAAAGWRGAAAVLGGGLLVEISFLSISGGIHDLSGGGRTRRGLLKVVGRYALLAFLAYVMIARLRLPPLGLIAGASSVVAAVGVEAARLLLKKKH